MIVLAWLYDLSTYWRMRVLRRYFVHGDEWVHDLTATAAQELGLQLKTSPFVRPTASGVVDGLQVDLEVWTVEYQRQQQLRFRVAVSGAPAQVSFRAVGPLDGARRGATGDELFDEHVVVWTPERRWFAHQTRLAIERCVGLGGQMSAGAVVLDTAGIEYVGAHDVLAAVRTVLDAARRVGKDPGRAEAVAEHDQDPKARVVALRAVLAQGPPREWILARLADPDPFVVLEAAKALGTDGAPHVRALLDGDAAPAAIAWLAPGVAPGADAELESALARVLARDPTRELLAVAGTLGGVGLVTALLRVTGPLKPAARDAVRAIQSRAAGERGGLALGASFGGGGEVSEAVIGGQVAEADAGPPVTPPAR